MTLVSHFLAQPLVRFLLTLGVIGIMYAWIWMPLVQRGIGGLWVKLVKKGNLGTFLTATVGHGLLVFCTLVAARIAIAQRADAYTVMIVACVFFWITTISDLFEDHATTTAQEKPHPMIVLIRLVCLLGWMTFILWSVVMPSSEYQLALEQTSPIFTRMWGLPYYGVIIVGIIGIYGLLRSVMKALFGTIGVFGLIFHPGPPKVTL